MEIVMQPIEVAARFKENGEPVPLRMTFNDAEIKIDQVLYRYSEGKPEDGIMTVFRCQSKINGRLTPFELKFECSTSKWFLFRK